MSFSRAKRFGYSPPLAHFKLASLSDEREVPEGSKSVGSDGQSYRKHVKVRCQVQCSGCDKLRYYDKSANISLKNSSFVRNATFRRSLPTIKVEKAPTHLHDGSTKVTSFDHSFSSHFCDDKDLNDTLSDSYSIFKADTKNLVVGDEKSSKDKDNELIYEKCVDKTFTAIQQLHCKTTNDMRIETKQKLNAFIQDINNTQTHFLEDMNQRYRDIITDLNKDITGCVRVSEDRWKNEKICLQNLIQILTIELQKSKENLEDINSRYSDLLNEAEREICDHKKIIGILKEELNALDLRGKLTHVLKSQNK